MREAYLHVPCKFNDGEVMPAFVLDTTVDRLVASFGGASVLPGEVEGYWKSPDGKLFGPEPMRRIAVAYEPNEANDAALTTVAEILAATADQQAVYVVYASGEVGFVEQPKAKKAA